LSLLWWTVGALGLLAACLITSRYSHGARIRHWQWILTPSGLKATEALALDVELDAAMADDAHTGAQRALRASNFAEATRLLELSFSVVETATPNRLTRLRRMATCRKMALAMLPLPPVRPGALRLRQVSTLAGFGKLAHYILVSSSERFVLRLRVLMIGFRIVSRTLRSSTMSACENPFATAAWETFEKGLADWKTLDREHLEAFHALMVSLGAQPAREALAQRA